jgi:hypothetical protein
MIPTLQKLGDHIANALERAAAAELRARDATDPELRLDNKRMAELAIARPQFPICRKP